jgi:hypothetical protein
MDHCNDFHPMRGYGHGGALFLNANQVKEGCSANKCLFAYQL